MAELAYERIEARGAEPRLDPRTESAPQAVLDWFTAICEAEGWTLTIEPGCEAWLRVVEREGHWVNPCFDPSKSDVDETNSLSIVIERTASGTFVAGNTLRVWRTSSFLDVIESGEIYYAKRAPEHRPLPLIRPADYPDLSGLIGYSGGTVVDPALRGARVGLMTTRMARLLAEVSFRVDHHTGLCFYPPQYDGPMPGAGDRFGQIAEPPEHLIRWVPRVALAACPAFEPTSATGRRGRRC